MLADYSVVVASLDAGISAFIAVVVAQCYKTILLPRWSSSSPRASYVTRMLDTSIVAPIGIHSGDVRRDNLWYDLYAASLRLEEFSRQLGA